MTQEPPAKDAAPASHASRGENPESAPSEQWVVVHFCPRCTYSHRVAFDQPPHAGANYAYICPYSGKEVVFEMLQTHPVSKASLFGVVYAHRVP